VLIICGFVSVNGWNAQGFVPRVDKVGVFGPFRFSLNPCTKGDGNYDLAEGGWRMSHANMQNLVNRSEYDTPVIDTFLILTNPFPYFIPSGFGIKLFIA
jgi:hypothetical protein